MNTPIRTESALSVKGVIRYDLGEKWEYFERNLLWKLEDTIDQIDISLLPNFAHPDLVHRGSPAAHLVHLYSFDYDDENRRV